jgi:hypothetical protein
MQKVKMIGVLCGVFAFMTMSAEASIIYTGQGTTDTYYQISDGTSTNGVTQLFTVPEGKVCTKVEMDVVKHPSWYQTSGYYTYIAVYAVGSYNAWIAEKTYQWTDPYWYDVTGAYLTASDSDLNLSAGTYQVQVWCNTAMSCARCSAHLYTDSTYSDGYAQAGWAGSKLPSMGNGYDFDVRLTLVPAVVVSERARMGWYDDRWGDLDSCISTGSAILQEGATVVLPYLSGVDFTTYQNHVYATGGDPLKLIFEFNRVDVNTENTSAIISKVQSFNSNPGVYGWYTADEPHGNGTALAPLVTAYTTIKANSGKPVFIAFNSGDLANQTPISYAAAYDVMMVDMYPFSSGSTQFQGLDSWKTFIASAKSQAATAGKEWWSIIQAYGTTSGYPLDFTMRLPTYTEANFMTFWSVLQGAKGVMLWSRTPCLYSVAQASAPYPYDGTQWAEEVAKPIMTIFKSCAVAIQDGEVSGGVTDSSTNVVSALYEDTATGEYFLIAANSTTGTQSNVQFTLTLPAGYVNAIPLGENREAIILSSGVFTDSFGDYETHVYRLMSDEQVINTYFGSNTTYWNLVSNNAACAVQWFTVPEETKGTKFEFLVEIGSAISSGYHCIVQIYSADGTYVAGGSKTADMFEANSDWVAVENLSLAPGKYYAQMFTNDTGFKGYLQAILVNPSTYADGYAAAGWDGGSALGDGKDFETRLTVVPNATVTTLSGDFNNDGKINATDIDLLSAAINSHSTSYATYDLTKDGKINSDDMDYLVKTILKTYYGDADLNRSVGVSDLSVLAAYYNTPSGASWANGDFDGNGAVGVSDLSILAANYNSGSSSTLSWAEAYAQAFGTTSDATADETTADEEDTSSTICSSLGLSLIAGLALMGLMIVKLEE